MKSTIRIIFILAMVSGMASTSVLGYLYKRERAERKRLKGNQTALMEDVKRYKTQDSLNVSSIRKLTLTKREFEQTNAELTDRVKELGIKVKRLQSVTSTGVTTKTEIKTEIKDSIVFRDLERTIRDTLKCMEYISPYLVIDACMYQGEFTGLVTSIDTLDQFIHRVPKKFLFIKFGTKGIRQEIYSRNPHSEIHYAKYIEIK
jgi:hypothetical protein